MKTYYFKLHIYYSVIGIFSLPVAIESKKPLTEYEVIQYVDRHNLLENPNDIHAMDYVDYIIEITEKMYYRLKTIYLKKKKESREIAT